MSQFLSYLLVWSKLGGWVKKKLRFLFFFFPFFVTVVIEFLFDSPVAKLLVLGVVQLILLFWPLFLYQLVVVWWWKAKKTSRNIMNSTSWTLVKKNWFQRRLDSVRRINKSEESEPLLFSFVWRSFLGVQWHKSQLKDDKWAAKCATTCAW